MVLYGHKYFFRVLNSLKQSTENGEVEVLIGKILFASIRDKLPNAVYAHLFDFLLSKSTFTFYSVLPTWLCVIHHGRDLQNMWLNYFKLKMSKLRNCLFKMKGIESNYSWRRSLRFSKKYFCLTIGHFKITQKGSFKVDSPLIGCYFWHFLTKRPIPWHFIFLK